MNIVLVEDHPITRQGLLAALERALPQARLSGVGTAVAALSALRGGGAVDLLLIDLRLPDSDGLSLLEEVRRRWPTVACVLVSGQDDALAMERAQSLGAMGYLPKHLEPATLVDEVLRVLQGERRFVPPPQAGASHGVRFTHRQAEVLRLVAQGQSSRVIAATLGIGERTVKDHLAVIFGRLDASTRAEAVARAAAMGLLPLGSRR